MSYWLQQIQSLSRIWKKYEQLNEDVASDTAIFIVGTHADDKICTPEHINNTLDGLKMIISKYKIQSFLKSFAVSCKTGKGITELKEALYLHFLDISTKKGVIPTSWVALGDYLMREKEERVAYIEWKSFESIAAKFKLSGSVLRSCTRYLMSIGSILHFPFKEHVDDMEMVVIDPKWLSDLMICFFTTQSTYVKKRNSCDNRYSKYIQKLSTIYAHAFNEFIGTIFDYFFNEKWRLSHSFFITYANTI